MRFRLRGRRTWPRREQERRGGYFVDRFDAMTLAMIVGLLVLTIADGVLTIELLDTNSEEINPLMAHLLLKGNNVFLLGKYILTAAGLPFLVAYKNYRMFGTRFRVGFLLPLFVGLYVALVVYQAKLLHVGRIPRVAVRTDFDHRARQRWLKKGSIASGLRCQKRRGTCDLCIFSIGETWSRFVSYKTLASTSTSNRGMSVFTKPVRSP